ncbi:uncharacterized protein TrAtP1_007809 [Trichoderma atroviride]|uniref:uncharacterized protein n=1 Tax=Hypocrea atroviridis TaxID=63577 RepID=UPI00333151E8|nr:hypothetical protein TrAtP1_007809 [Trichoderma atroviride]
MPHVPLLQKLVVSRRPAEVSFNKLPRYAAAETRASVRPNTAVQVFILSVQRETHREREKEAADHERGWEKRKTKSDEYLTFASTVLRLITSLPELLTGLCSRKEYRARA